MRRDLRHTFFQLAARIGIALAVVFAIVVFMYLRSPADAFGLPIGGAATLLRASAVTLLAFASWMVLGKKESTSGAIASAFLALVIGVVGLILIEGLVWIIRIVLP